MPADPIGDDFYDTLRITVGGPFSGTGCLKDADHRHGMAEELRESAARAAVARFAIEHRRARDL
jgi:hypothetical protein